jgi:putative transposase
MDKSSGLRSGRHVVFQLKAYLVFIPLSRRGGITAPVFVVLRDAFESVCQDFEGELLEASSSEDHVRLLVSYPPKVALSKLVNSLKGVSARWLRAATLPERQASLQGEHFWSPSYCVVSCGEAPLEIVEQFLSAQRERLHGTQRRGSSPP